MILSNRPLKLLCGKAFSAVQWCNYERTDELAERQWRDHQPQRVHQRCSDAVDEQTVHRENHFKDIIMPDSIGHRGRDLFEEVQLKIKKNSRAPARHKAEDDYLLTTKLFCGMCGAMMFGECGTGRSKVVHHYYKMCHREAVPGPARKKDRRKEWLEDLRS